MHKYEYSIDFHLMKLTGELDNQNNYVRLGNNKIVDHSLNSKVSDANLNDYSTFI